jgi:hypothetical protein
LSDDHPPALLRRQTGSSKGNNDRIVASQYAQIATNLDQRRRF